ncbi:hypothetical protein JHK87_045370 [Glycine soja]|nr:hypothetical protein JHK87_045370 [Glycine soja]
MIGNFIDDIDCGNFFDHIDDLLEFPDDAAAADTSAAAPVPPPANFWSAESDSLPATDTVFSDNSVTDLSAELSVPYEDIVQLEWLSNFVEDSFSGGSMTMKKEEPQCTTTKEDIAPAQFQTASPVSVLESSSFCSGEKAGTEINISVPCGRARSKRPRPATFNPNPVMQLISPASSTGENTQHNPANTSKASSDSENFAESVIKAPKQASGEHKKKKKIKVTFPSGEERNAPSQAIRKCLHCEITKTPQWRAGPMGPKTLCNACGVRYKSGRLFPEYRPAASPTFCAAMHSNSHKKVLEMRNKTGTKSGFATVSAASPELIPNTNSSLTLEYM